MTRLLPVLSVALAFGCVAPLAMAASGEPVSSGALPTSVADLRARVKHVFVIYQENRSFDSYFGTFPGVENLAGPLARGHGFLQHDAIGNQTIAPYRIADPDVADVDHSRPALYAKVDGGTMGKFVEDEELRKLKAGVSPNDAQRLGLLTMAHQDCDTVPFLWKYANAFALYDHIFQGMYGPSTPGNIDLVSAQTGLTQAARHPEQTVEKSDTGAGVPVVDDLDPAFGPYHTGKPRTNPIQDDLTFANLLLTLSGSSATDATIDNGDIKDDISALARTGAKPVPWGWYQEGFNDDGSGTYPAYVTHHDVPQFFGYIRQNPKLWANVHDLTELLPTIAKGTLGERSVTFVKGGYHNPFGWKPANPDPAVQKAFLGDDDHPGYSDSQLSESLVATVVNAVARSPYWNDSAIVVVWDDSEGFYDHVPPPQFEQCPDGRSCGDGPRVPLILISPFAKSHAIVSDPGDHASFAKFLNVLFDLTPLSSLPDEKPYLPQGPRDGNPALTDLLGGFDAARLSGTAAPIPASYAIVPDDVVSTFPAAMSCQSLGITPVTVPGGLAAPPPGFAPRLSPPTP
ncbi:MAG: alkaline phosphatase family protein [Candidatus Baltobacteraceae bacterium]